MSEDRAPQNSYFAGYISQQIPVYPSNFPCFDAKKTWPQDVSALLPCPSDPEGSPKGVADSQLGSDHLGVHPSHFHPHSLHFHSSAICLSHTPATPVHHHGLPFPPPSPRLALSCCWLRAQVLGPRLAPLAPLEVRRIHAAVRSKALEAIAEGNLRPGRELELISALDLETVPWSCLAVKSGKCFFKISSLI